MINTKIVATIGPSTWNKEVLKQMFNKGFRVARINSAFADYAEMKKVRDLVRSVSDDIALMMDTQGPKIRIKGINNPFVIKKDTILTVSTNPKQKDYPFVTYRWLNNDVAKGTTILIDDGNIRGIINDIKGDLLYVRILNDGLISDGKTVNVPHTKLNIPLLTRKDIKNIESAKKLGYEFISTSFVQTAKDIHRIRKYVAGSNIKIIAKIETASAIVGLDNILYESDAIMVARGDLGVELSLSQIPLLQKAIVSKCKGQGKPVIVATQMLESMKQNPRPTRAEATDVANAIIDGADAVMLSAETSIGKYPVLAVEFMHDVALEVEKSGLRTLAVRKAVDVRDYLVENAICLAKSVNAKSIVIYTKSGYTAQIFSSYSPQIPIIAITHNKTAYRQMSLYRSIFPIYVANAIVPDDRDDFVDFVVKVAKKSLNIETGSPLIVVNVSDTKNKKSNGIIEIYSL